jgi:release factor glutamine methyltransferase
MLFSEALKLAILALKESPTPALDARILLEFASQKPFWKIDLKENITQEALRNFQTLIQRRAEKEPVAYITCTKGFYGFDFTVSRDVLIPRPDSEIIVQTAIEIASNFKEPCQITDLCTGSGALIISVLSTLNNDIFFGTGVDISEKALKIAEINKAKISPNKNLSFINADIKNFEINADIVISNPPYIPSEEIKTLEENVKNFEPKIALDGGKDGLYFYRIIAEKGKKAKFVILEIGFGQAKDVSDIFLQEGYELHSIKKDLSQIERCLVFINKILP